ncbi:MAG: hypothetical protein SFT91_05155 [Rickettsiaceae bacterium]|nr:hypothetical protein [Rickettsiaceae bacterium]
MENNLSDANSEFIDCASIELIKAIETNQDIEIIEAIIARGADVNFRKVLCTPLAQAIMSAPIEVLNSLLIMGLM